MIGALARACLVALAILVSVAAQAQDRSEAPDYDAWEALASRAETVIARAESTTSVLTQLREDIAGWRSRLLAAENTNRERVATLRAQIEALGAAPDTAAGETEPEGISARRTELNQQLAAVEAPRLQASEAYNRADGLISEIDDIIQERQTEELLETVSSPINPVNWAPAASVLGSVTERATTEVRRSLISETTRGDVVRRLPVTLGLVALAVLLLTRGRRWTTQATDWVHQRSRRHGRIFMAFLTSLSQVLLPLLGIALLVAAILSLRVLGSTGQTLVQSLIGVVAVIYSTLWLTARIFPKDDTTPTIFGFDRSARASLRRTAILIGVVMGLWWVVSTINQMSFVTPVHSAVFNLPFFLALGLGFWRFGGTVRRAVVARTEAEDEASGFGLVLVGLLARALSVVAIAGPLAALAGYNNIAEALMVPTATTMWLLGLLVALQWPIRDVYAWITRTDITEAQDALIPVLVNFALVIAAIPLLALVWGMRTEQLSEVYSSFSQGIAFGGGRITPGNVLTVFLVFGIGYLLTRFLQRALKTTVLPRTRMDAGAQNAVASFVGYVGIGLAALFAITAGGIDLTALAVVFGALSVGIGFGLQNVVQNFVAGIILLIERPIGEGDWIEVGGQMGIVKSISVRSTTIETFDKTQVIVPNADFISGPVTNWTRGNQIGRAIVEVGVAYGTDTRRVEEILSEIANNHPGVAAFPAPGVDFMGFGASSLDFRMRLILRDVNTLVDVSSEVRHQIAERFAEEGIEIPFPQQDVWLRNAETLGATPPPKLAEDPA